MIAYVTPSATLVPVEKFIDAMKGNIQGFARNQAESIFNHIANGERQVSVSTVQQAINSDEFPELVEGFNLYATAYCLNGEDMSSDEFIQLLNDMYVASQELYQQAIGNMWRV